MALTMVKYYSLHKLIEKIDKSIINKINYANDLLFNYASFNDLSAYYRLLNPFKNDKFNISDKLKSEDTFFLFFINCIKECKKHDSYDELLFLYSLILNYLVDKNLTSYIITNSKPNTNFYKSCNSIEYYYANLYYKIDLSIEKLSTIFPNSFEIKEYQINLINEAMIKSFGFLRCENYYKKCINNYKYYLKHLTTSKYKIKYFLFKIYDIFRRKSKRKASTYIYFKYVNIELLNKYNKPYLIDEVTYNYSLEQLIEITIDEAYLYVEAINAYLFKNNNKLIKEIIPDVLLSCI